MTESGFGTQAELAVAEESELLTFADLAALESGAILVDEFFQGVRYIVMRGPGSLCAYVGVPLDHPLANRAYDSVSLECHGCLTFSGEFKRRPGWWWFGWDYSHLGDRAFYDLDRGRFGTGFYGDKEWTVPDVKREAEAACWEFAKLCRLAEDIARSRPSSATAADAASKPKTGLGDGSEIHRDGGETDGA